MVLEHFFGSKEKLDGYQPIPDADEDVSSKVSTVVYDDESEEETVSTTTLTESVQSPVSLSFISSRKLIKQGLQQLKQSLHDINRFTERRHEKIQNILVLEISADSKFEYKKMALRELLHYLNDEVQQIENNSVQRLKHLGLKNISFYHHLLNSHSSNINTPDSHHPTMKRKTSTHHHHLKKGNSKKFRRMKSLNNPNYHFHNLHPTHSYGNINKNRKGGNSNSSNNINYIKKKNRLKDFQLLQLRDLRKWNPLFSFSTFTQLTSLTVRKHVILVATVRTTLLFRDFLCFDTI
jgi:hypothetical protein